MAIHTIRDWRGIKTQLSRCTTAELINMLANSVATQNQVARFTTELRVELDSRGQNAHPITA